MKLIASFSGGKDSVLSIDRAIQEGHQIVGLITTFSGEESWFHQIQLELLQQMAEVMQMPLFPVQTRGGKDYEEDYVKALLPIVAEQQAEGIIFGDIDLVDHRKWCENLASRVNLVAVFPLWNQGRKELLMEFLEKGYKTIIKKVDKTKLDPSFLGKLLDKAIVQQLEKKGLDPCGENGEYHTLVWDGPLFRKELKIQLGEVEEDNWSYSIRMK